MRIFVIGGVTVSSQDERFEEEKDSLLQASRRLGQAIANFGHTAVVCSPFEGSADVEVMRGIAACKPAAEAHEIEVHFVDSPPVRDKLDEVSSSLPGVKIHHHPHPPPRAEEPGALRYAWLLCQLHALEDSQVTIALGGKPDGAANMLLLLAEGKGKAILPLPFLGGAAGEAFHRRRFELKDMFQGRVQVLEDELRTSEVVELAAQIATRQRLPPPQRTHSGIPCIFISYPKARPAEADHVESILRRRRTLKVIRDETDFGAGHDVPAKILDAIRSADIFLAIWCQEYACSPWCFDELEFALDRHADGLLEIWLLCVDETRIVPKRARTLLYFSIGSREELEGKVLGLLESVRQTRQTSDEVT